MPNVIHCNSCDFEVIEGYNHHFPGQSAACFGCGAIYNVKSTKGEWGFEVGEECHISLRGKNGKPQVVKALKGQEFNQWNELRNGVLSKMPDDEVIEYFIRNKIEEYMSEVVIPLSDIKCQKCEKKKLSLNFNEGDKCPKCKCGILKIDGRVIF